MCAVEFDTGQKGAQGERKNVKKEGARPYCRTEQERSCTYISPLSFGWPLPLIIAMPRFRAHASSSTDAVVRSGIISWWGEGEGLKEGPIGAIEGSGSLYGVGRCKC